MVLTMRALIAFVLNDVDDEIIERFFLTDVDEAIPDRVVCLLCVG